MQRGGGTVSLRKGRDIANVPLTYVNACSRVMQDFNNVIRGRGAPSVSGMDGFKSLAFALAAQEAAATGQRAVVARKH
jgi:1,5-anhydro-D-fructose reductase (1,5-anhydro-D-mannitol-forming)